MNEAIAASFSRAGIGCGVDVADRLEHDRPALEEQRVEDLVLGGEVVVDEAIGDAGLVGDVGDAAGVKALAREHAHGRVEDRAALVGGGLRTGLRTGAASAPAGPLPGERRPGLAIAVARLLAAL